MSLHEDAARVALAEVVSHLERLEREVDRFASLIVELGAARRERQNMTIDARASCRRLQEAIEQLGERVTPTEPLDAALILRATPPPESK